MTRRLTRRTYAVVVLGAAPAVALLAIWGCNAIVDSGDYHVVQPGPDGNLPPGTDAPANVDACVAITSMSGREQLESQCTPYDLGCQAAPSVTYCDAGSSGSCNTGPAAPAPVDAAPPPVDGNVEAAVLPSCRSYLSSTYPGTTPVISSGSTALKSFIGQVQKGLALSQNDFNVILVYQGTGSCAGVDTILTPAGNNLTFPTAAVTYVDPSGNAQTLTSAECDITQDTPDIGFSDVFYTSCSGFTMAMGLPQGVTDYLGPVQTMNFIVPASSSQTSITLTEANYVFGNGGGAADAGGPVVMPWTNPSLFFIRNSSSGTQAMISEAISLSAGAWWGVNSKSSQGVIINVTNSNESNDMTTIAGTIGIAASDVVDQNRQGQVLPPDGGAAAPGTPTVKILAVDDDIYSPSYACTSGGGAVYPDSTSSTFDKLNTRNGIYPIWGPSHLYASSSAQAGTATIQTVVSVFTGFKPIPGTPLVANYAFGSVVPQCAMHVTRSEDGKDYAPLTASSPSAPPHRCDCYFDSKVPAGTTTCTMCNPSSTTNTCPTGTECVAWDGNTMGYCEETIQ